MLNDINKGDILLSPPPPPTPYYIYYPAQMVGRYAFLPHLWYMKCRVCAIVGMQESAYLCNVNN